MSAHPTLMSERRAQHAVQAAGLIALRLLRACGPVAQSLATGMHRPGATGAEVQAMPAPRLRPGIFMSSEFSKRARQRVPLQLNDVQWQQATGNLAPFSLFARETFGVRLQGLCANMVRV